MGQLEILEEDVVVSYSKELPLPPGNALNKGEYVSHQFGLPVVIANLFHDLDVTLTTTAEVEAKIQEVAKEFNITELVVRTAMSEVARGQQLRLPAFVEVALNASVVS